MPKAKDETKDRSATPPDEANDIGQVPDPPFHGKWQLDTTVHFANAEGGETVVEAGVIEGSDLPLKVAQDLYTRGLIWKV